MFYLLGDVYIIGDYGEGRYCLNITFLNEDEMVEMMEELGFQVIRVELGRISNLDKFAEVMNSCSVMVGAHGVGLTNEIFLPTGAVMVQAVPLENEWVATNYFRVPTKEIGVRYLEYKIEPPCLYRLRIYNL